MVAAAILAGGKGRRLGGLVKPLLPMPDGGRIIDAQLAVLRPLFGAVVVVAAADDDCLRGLVSGGHAAPVITDRQGPGWGPLAGLDAGLAWLPVGYGSLVCVAGDMPRLDPAVLTRLRDAPASALAVVPRWGGRPEPLCARYDRSLGPIVSAQLAAGHRAMRAFIHRLATDRETAGTIDWIDEEELRGLDPTLATFCNINTPDDLGTLTRPARSP